MRFEMRSVEGEPGGEVESGSRRRIVDGIRSNPSRRGWARRLSGRTGKVLMSARGEEGEVEEDGEEGEGKRWTERVAETSLTR